MVRLAGLAGRRVLVTGGKGFIGVHLRRRLLAAGAEVTGSSRSPPTEESLDHRWIAADCTDPEAVEALFKIARPEIVYHLASAGANTKDLAGVLPVFRSDLMSTVTVMTAAAQHGAERTIITASLEEPATLAEPPLSAYAAAKTASGLFGRLLSAVYAHPVVILRPFMGYGPGQAATKLVPSAIRAALAGEPLRMGSGAKRTDWIFVEDLAEAFELAAQVTPVPDRTLDLATGATHSVREVVETINRLIPDAPAPTFDAAIDKPTDKVSGEPDMQATLDALGWRAKTSLEEGLGITIARARAAQMAS